MVPGDNELLGSMKGVGVIKLKWLWWMGNVACIVKQKMLTQFWLENGNHLGDPGAGCRNITLN
jgi:hypothetical protein